VTGDRDRLQETFDASEEDMSFGHRLNEFLQLGYTFNKSTLTNHYHVVVIQQNLSRNIGTLMTEIVDEAQTAMDDEIVVTDGITFTSRLMIDWKPFVPYEKALKIIARVSNRVFVGLPLCMTLIDI
jgi:hypothetical protein